MTETPNLPDLNMAPDSYRDQLTEFYQRHAGKWGGPLQDLHYMAHDALWCGYRMGGGEQYSVFSHEELIEHPRYGEVAFLGSYMGKAWIITDNSFETVPIDSLRRRADIPTEEKVISFEERRMARMAQAFVVPVDRNT